MTKLKSKKLSKSTIAIIIMAIAMVALLTFGATFALFSAQATDVATDNLTLGSITLKSTGKLTIDSGLVFPGQKIYDSSVSADEIKVQATGNDTAGEYVAVRITATVDGSVNAALTVEMEDSGVSWTEYTYDHDSNNSTPDLHTGIFVYCGASGSDPAGLTSAAGAKKVIKDIVLDEGLFDHSTQTSTDGVYTYSNSLMGQGVVVTIEFRALQKTANTTATSVADIANYLFGASGTLETTLHPVTP